MLGGHSWSSLSKIQTRYAPYRAGNENIRQQKNTKYGTSSVSLILQSLIINLFGICTILGSDVNIREKRGVLKLVNIPNVRT